MSITRHEPEPLLDAWPGGLPRPWTGAQWRGYGHLFPGHDDELRDRLDAMHAQGLRAVPAARWWSWRAARRGHGEASNEEGPPS